MFSSPSLFYGIPTISNTYSDTERLAMTSDMEKPHILVVEDVLGARRELSEMLEFIGYEVEKTTSGIQAVNRVISKGKEIDAILMDIKMPGKIDGIEATRKIQAHTREVPVVFVTAFSNNEEYQTRVREYNLHLAGWIDKPIIGENRKQLMNILQKEMTKKQLRLVLKSFSNGSVSQNDLVTFLEKQMKTYGIDLVSEVFDDMEWIYSDKQVYRNISFIANSIVFDLLHKDLERKHPGEYVAIRNCRIIHTHKDRVELRRILRNQLNVSGCLIQREDDTMEREIIHLRRPRKVIKD